MGVELMTTPEPHCPSVRDNPHDSPVLHRVEGGQGSSFLSKNFTTVEKVHEPTHGSPGHLVAGGFVSPGGVEKMRWSGKEWTP